MNISLQPEYEQSIQSQIKAENYTSIDEVVNAALSLLAEREQRLAELRQKISVGTEQISIGQVTDSETVFAQLHAKINSYE